MCGIFGYSGNNFNKYKFNILGLYNDTRGGDSCGIFIRNKRRTQYGYGHDNTKLYSDFISAGALIDFNDVNFAFGHCRKASVGGIGLQQAQPVIIKDDNGAVQFVMIHNGTLINYKELADKYNVEHSLQETDSQIFAKTIYKAGYEVLSMYNGAGSFMFWDKRDGKDSIRVFKGASLYYEHDNTIYVERPLFMLKSKNSIWVSSMESSLKFINDEDSELIDIECNKLYLIKSGEIVSKEEFDRSKMKSIATLAFNKNFDYSKYRNDYKKHTEYNKYSDWDSMDDDAWKYARTNYVNKKDFNDNDKSTVLEVFKTCSIVQPNKSGSNLLLKDKIIFSEEGIYCLNGSPCHGIINATPAGYVDGLKSISKNYYFVFGVMVKSYFDYLTALEYCEMNFGQEDEPYPVFLAKYSTTPVPMTWVNEQTGEEGIWLNIYDEKEDAIDFSGNFSPYFSYTKEVYTVISGEIVNYTKLSTKHEYEQDLLSKNLDDKIIGKMISDQELQQLILNNL